MGVGHQSLYRIHWSMSEPSDPFIVLEPPRAVAKIDPVVMHSPFSVAWGLFVMATLP
jgi:hypothetical protein